jgi:nucleoside-diphosphate-sugar epimerase
MAPNGKILVTGGAGYIGSTLVSALLDANYEVTVLDNFMFHQASLSHVCARPEFDLVYGDARSEETLKRLVAKADIVIPLAALVGAPLCDRDTIGAITTNRDAVVTLVKMLSQDQRVLIPVTNSGYGIGEEGKICTEETPLRPISLYGRTKVEAEEAVLDFGNSVSLRLATVFGMSPRMRLDLLVNDFVFRAVNDRFIVIFEGHFKRNYIHVLDVARGFLHGLANFDRMKGEPFNLGLSDANLSKLELCERIKAQVPDFTIVEAAIGQDPDKRDYIVSNEKIENTGYSTAHGLDDGIAELIKGYRMIRNSGFANV